MYHSLLVFFKTSHFDTNTFTFYISTYDPAIIFPCFKVKIVTIYLDVDINGILFDKEQDTFSIFTIYTYFILFLNLLSFDRLLLFVSFYIQYVKEFLVLL
jgi:hypothetical protein